MPHRHRNERAAVHQRAAPGPDGAGDSGPTVRRARTVYVVDDDEAVCDALRLLLGTAGLHVEALPSAYAFLQRYRGERPACLVLDVRMPGMSGLTLQDELADRRIDLPIVFLTGHADIPVAVEAMKKGAFDFIEKPFERHRLLCAVVDALDTDAGGRADRVQREETEALFAALTRRERAVLEAVLGGKTTREIAAELFVSAKTVEFHRARVKRRLGVATTAALFRLCLLAGEGLPRNR